MVAPQTVSLGTYDFDELQFEVPENLEINKRTLGGSVEIPQAPGSPAQVATQTLGVIVEPIKIDAWFIGANALDNARKLEAIQLQQLAIPFTFGPLSFSVTVMAFGKKFRSINEIGYSLDLTPQIETSVTNGGNGDGSATSALASTLQDIADTDLPTSFETIADSDSPTSFESISDAQDAAANADPANATLDDMQSLSDSLQGGISSLGGIMTATIGSTDVGSISTYLQASNLRGIMASAVSTIGTFTGANVVPTIQSGGLNAYQLITRYTGDINNLDDFMSANNLNDPFNIGPGPFVIPTGIVQNAK